MQDREGEATPSAAPRGWRAWARSGTAVVLLLTFSVLVARLALSTSHGVRSAAACRRAYAAARTHADTVSVDMLSYPDSVARGSGFRRPCGELRTATIDLSRR